MNKINNDKMLICITKCPELDCDNEKHCTVSERHYQEDIMERDFCPCGNKEIMIELK